jgi:tRNA U34 5-methylaminomethyl-2-thiouridine-forming methyltransferase MnmC
MRSPRIARGSLVLLAVSALSIGLVATVAPRTFYDDFPFVAHWVELLPPYNEHLVTDVGGLYLGFVVIFAFAAATLERTLVRAAACAWLLVAAIHLGFHAGHLDGFSTADAVAELGSLAFLVVLPAVALWAVGPGRGETNEGTSG